MGRNRMHNTGAASRFRRLSVGVTTMVGVLLVTSAVAWACNPQSHQFVLNPRTGSSLSSTAITVSGICDNAGGKCTHGSDRNIWIGRQVSLSRGNGQFGDPMWNNPAVTQREQSPVSCDANSTVSIDIGNLTTSTSGTTMSFSGTGTVPSSAASGLAPGYHAVCAGIDPIKLWDNFLLA